MLQGDDNQKAAEKQKRETEDMKNSILTQVLDQQARARCKYISNWQISDIDWKLNQFDGLLFCIILLPL